MALERKKRYPGGESENGSAGYSNLQSPGRLTSRGRTGKLCRHGWVSKIISEQIRQRQFEPVFYFALTQIVKVRRPVAILCEIVHHMP